MFETTARTNTRTRILDAAEALFAERGFDATTVRDITEAANANVAAVNYHFGSKEALLRAVTDRVVGPLNARRRELLAELERRGDAPPVAAVLEAFIRPDIETMQRVDSGLPTMARFLGRTYAEPTPWIQEMALDQFGAIGEEFGRLFAAALPHLDQEEVSWRMRHVVAVVLNLFATYPVEGLDDEQAEATVARVVTFLTPAMAAQMPPGR
jgi:AcrR family transcriptional regulator